MVPASEDHGRIERGRALVRSLHLSELQAAGAARAVALHDADVQLDRVARLLPDALSGGLSLTEISRVTGVSRPTLYELRGRYSDAPGDLRLAVLQAIASRGTLTPDALYEVLGGHSPERERIVGDLQEQDIIDFEFDDEAFYFLTSAGFALLEHWTFEELESEDGGE